MKLLSFVVTEKLTKVQKMNIFYSKCREPKYRSTSDKVHLFPLDFPRSKCIPSMKLVSLVSTEKLT